MFGLKERFSNTYSLFFLSKKNRWLFLDNPQEVNFYYKNRKIDYINNIKTKLSPCEILEVFKKVNKNSCRRNMAVWHLTYELGHLFFKDQWDLITKDDLLAVEIIYKKKTFLDNLDFKVKESVSFTKESQVYYKDYKKDFDFGYQKLYEGHCYQFNLTYNFKKYFKNRISVVGLLQKIAINQSHHPAVFAHGTFIKETNMGIVSNSPECLFNFHYQKNYLYSMPIKGSASVAEHGTKSKAYDFLTNSIKDQAELNMITDLIRNDLSRIGPYFSKVMAKRSPLIVPGIVHQYSKIRVKIGKEGNLCQTLKGIFPGGSITGAPKKRVMEILKIIEKRSRGFYTGSTLLLTDQGEQASINIRTLTLDYNDNSCSYGAGGGITLLSESKSEYKEMKLKVESFFGLLK